jgi:hypothetical protein
MLNGLEDTEVAIKEALRKALEQPEQEPVCFLRETSWSYEIAPWDDPNGIPVYTAPPISDYHEGWEEGFKAATREHEPVAWMKPSGLVSPYQHGSYQIPLYTAPPKREWVGLTDEEIQAERHKLDTTAGWTYDHFARAIEAKLKDKNI